MDRSTQIYLISVTYTTDALKQRVPTEHRRAVFAAMQSVTMEEWTQAGQLGLSPEFRAVVFAPEYNGEEIVEVKGKRFSVYRTYQGKNENLELYLGRKAGTK